MSLPGHGGPADAIRPVVAADLPALRRVIDATGLFPSAMLGDMIAGYLSGDAPDEIWLTDAGEAPCAIAYAAPERMTEGTWNLYLIAVHPSRQREGRGAALVRHMEDVVSARGGRILLVETSGLAEFEGTRAFYRQRGYAPEARIRDFYREGEDKVVFRKRLAAAA